MTRCFLGLRVVLAVAALGLGGCEAVFNPTTEVALAISHHGTRDMTGMLPDYGAPEDARIFVNDQGWEITLAEGVIVMTSAQIESCTGESFDFTLPYGPFPEHMLAQDKDLVDFGIVDLPKGQYCKLRVEYGRYQAALAEMAFDTPYTLKGHAPIEGKTVYLAGTSERADGTGEVANWGFETNNTTIVELDLSTSEDGHPFTITTNEPGNKALTVAKTYDAFFKGLDFASYDKAAWDAKLLDTLKADTYVVVGPQVF